MAKTKQKKPRIKPLAFIKRYGRILLGGSIIVAVVFCSIFADFLTDWDPEKADIKNRSQEPTAEHILGTDIYGRDMWSRILFGSRTTLIVSLGSQLLLMFAGTVLGLLCGYYNKIEKYLMRFMDAFATIPNLLLCMLMISVFSRPIS